MRLSDQRLLGRLATSGWFSANGEVAMTRSVGYLLESDVLRDATITFLTESGGVDLSDVQRVVVERVNADGNRPDIEGRDVAGKPLLVVEAKFAAAMRQSQVSGYMKDQAKRLGADGRPARGLLVLLVPEARAGEADLKAQVALRDHPADIATLVVTWARWLKVWEDAIAASPERMDGLASDVEQLKAMCHTLGGMVVAPLREAASGGPGWLTRYDEYAQVVNQVTKVFGPTFPIGSQEKNFAPRRYFPSGFVRSNGEPAGYASVGLQHVFAADDLGPIWLRFHRRTFCFSQIRDRIVASDYRASARADGGHLWLPLSVDPELAGPDLIESLIDQIHRIQSILRDEYDIE